MEEALNKTAVVSRTEMDLSYLKEQIVREIIFLRELMIQKNESLALAIIKLEDLTTLKSQLTQIALDKAEQSVDKRLEQMNEFRQQMGDMITRFATLDKLDSVTAQLDTRIVAGDKHMNERFDSTQKEFNSRKDIINKELDELKQFKAEMLGRNQIIIIIWPIISSIIMLIVSHFLSK